MFNVHDIRVRTPNDAGFGVVGRCRPGRGQALLELPVYAERGGWGFLAAEAGYP
jgi:hypothetical protein